MKFYYTNLKVGDKFKVPGYDTTYVRVHGGYRNVNETIPNRVLKTGAALGPTGPVRDGTTEVEYIAPDDWNKVIDGIGQRRRDEQADLNAKLGDPHVFVPDPDDDRFGIGYWRIDGGIMSYRRYVYGYDPLSRHEYTDDFIDLLTKLKAR